MVPPEQVRGRARRSWLAAIAIRFRRVGIVEMIELTATEDLIQGMLVSLELILSTVPTGMPPSSTQQGDH